MSETTLLLLRHGEVASHRGDVPVTPDGLTHAETVGRALAGTTDHPITLLYGGTRRTRETAQALARGLRQRHEPSSAPGHPGRAAGGPDVDGPHDSFALRNPDMYVAGTRVNMVSSPQALADQVAGMDAQQAASNPWWSHFFDAPDRIGWWLEQDDPPGETGTILTQRVLRFAGSLLDPGPLTGRLVVGVTHSPLLRSVLRHATGTDPGEPPYVTGARLHVHPDRRIDISPVDLLAVTG